MPELADSAQYTSMDLKDRGNQWFSEKKYDQALASYSDAIVSPVDTKYQASINYVCTEQHVHGDEGEGIKPGTERNGTERNRK